MMKTFLTFLIMVSVSFAFAADAKKTDIATMKKIEYYKIIATEEINILERFIKCLNTAENRVMLDKCSNDRQRSILRLRKTATPKSRQEGKR